MRYKAMPPKVARTEGGISVERLTTKRKWEEARRDLHSELGYSHIWKRLNAIEDILGDDYDIDRLRELVQADRDGRCVVLPCKVGDVLYSAFPLCGINTHQVRKFERNSEGDFACSALMIPLSDFGKTVFLTRESAETALEKTEG